MGISVDSTRRAAAVRRTRKAAGKPSETAASEAANLPVLLDPPTPPLAAGAARASDAAIRAQVIGERRGLRAGPTIHDEARTTYNRVAWSGGKDRRRPKGGAAKTEV